MKTIIKLLLIFSIPVFAFAQDYTIEYNHIIKFETNSTEALYRLESNKKESIYYQLKSDFVENEGNEVIQANEGVIPFIYKSFSSKEITYNQPIINKIYFIKDSLPIQKWKINKKTKVIASFECKMATTNFRGRKYTAWYTESIPIIGGPWKFDGLPGLILEIYSDDGVLNIQASKIEKMENSKIREFVFKKENLISWNEYSMNYKKVIERIRKSMKADNDTDVEYDININLVEIIDF